MSGGTRVDVTITGFKTCAFYIRAVSVSKKIAKSKPAVSVDLQEFGSQDEYKAWLEQEHDRLAAKYGSAAASHTSSPFVVADASFIGGCDALLAKLAADYPDVDMSPPKAVVPKAPGLVVQKIGLAADLLKVGLAVAVVSIVGRIGPLRRFLVAKALSHMHTNKVVSSYDEGKLMENAFDKPCVFGAAIWHFIRMNRMSSQVSMDGLAPNAKLLDIDTGAEKLLYDYQHGDRPLVLNFGSQS